MWYTWNKQQICPHFNYFCLFVIFFLVILNHVLQVKSALDRKLQHIDVTVLPDGSARKNNTQVAKINK